MAELPGVIEAIARERRPSLVGYAFLICGSMPHAEQAAQDAIVGILSRAKSGLTVRDAEDRIEARIVKSLVDRARRDPAQKSRGASLTGRIPTRRSEPWMGIHSDVHDAIEELTVAERACVVLRYVDQRSTAQIVALTRLSVTTVDRYMENAISKIETSLEASSQPRDQHAMIRAALRTGVGQ